jgi:hypothetical protein
MLVGVGSMHGSGIYTPQPRCGLASGCWVGSSRARTLGMHVCCWCSWLELEHHVFVSGLVRLMILLLTHLTVSVDSRPWMVPRWKLWLAMCTTGDGDTCGCRTPSWMYSLETHLVWLVGPPLRLGLFSQCGSCLCVSREVSMWSLPSSPSCKDSGLST